MTYITNIETKTIQGEFDKVDIIHIEYAKQDDYFYISAVNFDDNIGIYVSDSENLFKELVKRNESLIKAIDNDEPYEYEGETDADLDYLENYGGMTTMWFLDYKESKYCKEIEYVIYKLDQLANGNEMASVIEDYELENINFEMPKYKLFSIDDLMKSKKRK